MWQVGVYETSLPQPLLCTHTHKYANIFTIDAKNMKKVCILEKYL